MTFQLLVWLVPGEKYYGLGTGFQIQTIPVPLYVLNPMGLLWFPGGGWVVIGKRFLLGELLLLTVTLLQIINGLTVSNMVFNIIYGESCNSVH